MADEYPMLADGTKVPFRPSQRPRLSEWMLHHVVERHAGTDAAAEAWPGKTKFPSDWTTDEIAAAVDATLAAPPAAPVRLGDKLRFERTVAGQLVRVQVRVDLARPEIWNAYPVDGAG